MLTLKNITIKTNKDRVLIDQMNLTVIQGDRLAIIGEEGNGKSTLCKMIVDQNFVDPSFSISGEIKKDRIRIGYLPQQLSDIVLKTLLNDFLLKDTDGFLDYSKQADLNLWLNRLHVNVPLDHWEEPMSQLSGGERIKVQIVKLMSEDPDLLILDEPTNDLDLSTLKNARRLIIE